MKQLMAGAGVAIVGMGVGPLIPALFPTFWLNVWPPRVSWGGAAPLTLTV